MRTPAAPERAVARLAVAPVRLHKLGKDLVRLGQSLAVDALVELREHGEPVRRAGSAHRQLGCPSRQGSDQGGGR